MGEVTRPPAFDLTFRVPGVTKPKGSLKHVGGGHMAEQVKGSGTWREAVAWCARAAMNASNLKPGLVSGPVCVVALVYVPRPAAHFSRSRYGGLLASAPQYPTTRSSGDSDKLARNILDALSGEVYVDDSQVVDLHVAKRYVSTRTSLPETLITVRSVNE